MTTTDDGDLVLRCLEGDRWAFGVLVERYQMPIFNAALRMVRSAEDAADITQSVFLKAYENLHRFDPKFKFFSWIYRIAIHESINFVERRRPSVPLDETRRDDRPRPDGALELSELSHRVQEALMRVSAQHRAVIVLRHFLGCSYREIADVLNLPEKTVKSRLFSARKTLKQVLGERETP